ncbi:LytTR family transcriptional regulator DNA-binding domain-containing protein [Sandarakinorhabdus sp. AAP62]|uniref:LytTR family DNA-binding domain-containing protein n=1 Tax=Sandarakinorhabdus sp. AAP62 TaxID=1248916 RepID=UPI00030B7397|nr:LytTR family transcriptional regulator DNA-binding domain-containing protein [Sandarakinorhabdus sp. AAP62]
MESTLSLSRATAPPLRPMIAGTLFAVVACALTGPFDTLRLPLPSRLVFWLVLIGWNSVKWWLWYAWAGPRTTSRRAAVLVALAGTVLLNATLPLEIDLMFRAIGQPQALSWAGLYLSALLVAGSISALVAVIRGGRAVLPDAPPVDVATPSLLAQRAGLTDLAGVLMVAAEDHYLRLVLADGPNHYRRPLVLFRLSDALPELAACNGAQVHRSAWVARRHVAGARRDGRRWLLVLADGTSQAISETHLPALRAAGWLQTKL